MAQVLGKLEYGVHHPDGRVTVRPDGHAFYTPLQAMAEASMFESAVCSVCDRQPNEDGKEHKVVARSVGPWTITEL